MQATPLCKITHDVMFPVLPNGQQADSTAQKTTGVENSVAVLTGVWDDSEAKNGMVPMTRRVSLNLYVAKAAEDSISALQSCLAATTSGSSGPSSGVSCDVTVVSLAGTVASGLSSEDGDENLTSEGWEDHVLETVSESVESLREEDKSEELEGAPGRFLAKKKTKKSKSSSKTISITRSLTKTRTPSRE
jgi:hypothetical protein